MIRHGNSQHTLLGADSIDLAVCTQNTTIELNVSVPHSHTQINQYVLTHRIGDDFSENLPAVEFGVILDA